MDKSLRKEGHAMWKELQKYKKKKNQKEKQNKSQSNLK